MRMRRANKAQQLSARLRPARRKIRLWSQWLLPGLLVKRWLLISAVGVLLASLGFAISINLTPIFYFLQFLEQFVQSIARFVPSYISGPLLLLGGLALIAWGYARTLGSITEVLLPEDDKALVERLLTHRRLGRGPKIVAIGGGTGLSTLLRGLKLYSSNITAIVTMADDGGSSGRLRREIGVLPPGDIRNCLAALADEEKIVTELFQYRFEAGDGLAGHSFGNLFLTAMTNITGDLERAIATSSAVLAIRGQVLPATLTDMTLWARLADGRLIHGESNITAARGKIVEIGCSPPAPKALPRAIQALHEADYIILGPGSLYTSIIPNLLVPEIAQALAERQCPCVYVCNIMTQPGETDGYAVSDHVRALDAVTGDRLFDAVLVQKYPPSAAHLERYAQQGSTAVAIDREALTRQNCRLILADVMDESTPTVRHDSQKLAAILMRWYERVRSL
ncbi:YvcK family protein [Thermosynechococcus sp. QKsg1]|nr:YvcK family protein [Thermosynechococcus sp. CL-1]WJI24759.1 YvcK family protein [Thermosynechococcus sp. B0]WJI29808.1 YvcK family protein [Thermosynechococcus sp. B3]WKT84396.1 YvcK family protein [Thermosynechococcus sp. HY596]WNC63529.1 YvcK family protein [Thermosynechococcus sp. HY591]WNC66727.1 YvcK family protein [Thermosynechococcus sp. HY593]WNC87399.1 YvcK family protein [Thermosynechococcus sp. QKsg1]